MKLWRTLGISLVALALLLAGQGSAFALVEQVTLDELASKADSIIIGEVIDITSNQEGEGNIYTLVTISVEQAIKGETQGEVVIRLPGGEVDGLGLWVEDAPSFKVGERTVVFLAEVDSAFEVCGWYQGKFTVQDDRIVETNQSLTSFMADISQAMEAQGITPKASVRPGSMVLESPVESKAVEPEKTEEFLTGWQNIMTDGFEGAFPGTTWSLDGTPTWDKESYRAHTGTYSVWCAGSSYTPPTNYPNNMNAWMVYGPFSLADATDAELNYYLWLDAEYPHDSIEIRASIDNINYYYGEGWTDYTDWKPMSFDLTNVDTLGNLCGQSQVWIAFIFTSDNTITDDGAFIDNVVLRKYVTSGEFDLVALEVYLSTQPGDTNKNYVVNVPSVGQAVYFHFKWNCVGSGTTPSFRTDLKLDGITSCYGEGTVEGGTNYMMWCSNPWMATAGSHTLTGILDVYNDVPESNETNNQASKSWGAPSEATWTFMAYLDGDNDLEGSEIASFNLMESAANNANVNVIVQLDRIPGYDSSNGDWTTTRRYKVKYDTNINNFASYTEGVDYWDLGELNMAAPTTLSDFVSWTKTYYPADHYCLVLANHGDGWQPLGVEQRVPTGILWDNTSGGYMSTAELGTALNSATSGGTQKLDVLFLDACLMQMIEVGYEVKNYSQYLVASEYYGWTLGPYDDYISAITATTTAEELATTIVNEYHNDLTGDIYAHTMSAVELAQFGLASVVDDFAQKLTTGLPTYKTQIENSRTDCQNFVDDSYIDLYHFAFLIDKNIADPTIQNAAQAVMTAVNNAVIAEAHESGSGGEYYALDNAYGISIYFPASEGDSGYINYNSGNLEFVADKGWDEFLAALFGGSPAVASVSIVPGNQMVYPSGSFNVNVVVDSAALPVKGCEVTVTFDASYLTATAATGYNLLGTAAETLRLGPMIPNGEVSYSVVRTAGNDPAAVAGDFITIDFNVDPAATGTYSLTIEATLLDENNIPIAGVVENDGQVNIDTNGRKGDFDGDGDIDIFDFVQFADAYGSETGDPNYNAIGDFNDDGHIDIFDFVDFADVYGT
jgi:hypothetical protein